MLQELWYQRLLQLCQVLGSKHNFSNTGDGEVHAQKWKSRPSELKSSEQADLCGGVLRLARYSSTTKEARFEILLAMQIELAACLDLSMTSVVLVMINFVCEYRVIIVSAGLK